MLAEVWPTAIPLRRADGTVRAYTLVDSVDWSRVTDRPWHMSAQGYAMRTGWRDGRTVDHELLHHRVMGRPPAGLETDHVNRNRLDNRRANLRFVTHAENMLNVRGRGVSLHKPSGLWFAYVKVAPKKRKSLGYYKTEAEALAVAAAAKEARDAA